MSVIIKYYNFIIKIDRFRISTGNATTFHDATSSDTSLHPLRFSLIHLNITVVSISGKIKQIAHSLYFSTHSLSFQLLSCSCLWWSEPDAALYT